MNKKCEHTERAEQLIEELMNLCSVQKPAAFTMTHPFTHSPAQFIELVPFENMLNKITERATDLYYWWDNE